MKTHRRVIRRGKAGASSQGRALERCPARALRERVSPYQGMTGNAPPMSGGCRNEGSAGDRGR